MQSPGDDNVNPQDGLDGATDLLLDSQGLLDVSEDAVALGRLQVMVIGKSTFATVAIPGPGTVTIGRNNDCTIRIEDASISRRHVALHVGSTELEIEDLGSVNGTRVRNCAIEPNKRVRIALGEIVGVGKTTIVVQQRSTMLRPRRVWDHEDFKARLGEECARAERVGTPLALLRIESPRGSAKEVQELLADLLRQSDVVAAYGPHSHEVLLPDTARGPAEDVAVRISSRLRERGIECTISRAHFPTEGRTAHALIARLGHVAEPGTQQDMVVRDPVMVRLYGLVKRVALSNIGVLILGETGVGKDGLAERVHQVSARSGKPFLQLNCAGLTETMLESELFGHEKGAFTNAIATKEGLLETADGGTVFLDEIGDMPRATQAKLLRVIEDGNVRRVGGIKPRPIDVRFIAATNHDLDAAVEAGTFRRDLYFRLNGVTLVIPPLRDRVSEIEPLAHLFAQRAAAQAGVPEPKITPEALERLRTYAWPGNVRELKNVISRAVILSTDGEIGLAQLPNEKLRTMIITRGDDRLFGEHSGARALEVQRRKRRGPEEAEWIRAGLEAADGNQTRAAKLLGISRRTLIKRLEEYGFARPRKDVGDQGDT